MGVCWLALAGCGRSHFDYEAVPDAAVPPDAYVFVFGPFTTPTPVPAFSDPNEDDDPTLTDDLLEIYWEGQRWPGDKITFSTRTALDQPWSTPIIAPGLEIGDSCPEVSHDGLTIMFSSNVAG